LKFASSQRPDLSERPALQQQLVEPVGNIVALSSCWWPYRSRVNETDDHPAHAHLFRIRQLAVGAEPSYVKLAVDLPEF
jgi:hypothetical protein